MAKLTSPSISITFLEKAASLIERGSRGIVALVLRDASVTETPDTYTVRDVSDVPTTLSEANQQYIKDALKGYSKAPLKVLVYVMPTTAGDVSGLYSAMMKYFETETFQWMAIPTVETDGKVEDIVSWVKSQRNNNNYMIKAVLPNADSADCEGIINWASKLYRDETSDNGDNSVTITIKTYTAEQVTPRIAGIFAGTDVTISATYAPLKDFDDVERLDSEARNTAVGTGKLLGFWDGEKVKLDRAVTSFVTTTGVKGDSFKKAKLVEDMDMIKSDIQTTIQDSYIGKYANSYDNKCLLITAINGYFQTLVNDGIIESGTAEIDLTSQRTYLESLGKSVTVNGETKKPEDLSDDEVKIANTGSHVFLRATVVLLDAIEDVSLTINV